MGTEWLTLLGLYVLLFGASSASEDPQGNVMIGFVGCFRDQRDHALPYDMGRVNNIMDCIDLCRENELPYAGLQRGDECHCGTDHAKYGEASNCNRRCRSGEICGGDMANSVYKVGPPLLKPTHHYVGCYKDERRHAMSNHVGRSQNIEGCIKMCEHNGFAYAGIERGEECFCGATFDKYGKTKICKVRCRSHEICGGEMALSVYKVGPADSRFEIVGCFKDDRKNTLTHFMGNVNNVETCIEICRQNTLPYAGLMAGRSCFCGDKYDRNGKDQTCNMKCKSGELCGGRHSNSVYKVGEKIHDPVLRRAWGLFDFVGCYRDSLFHRALNVFKGQVNSIGECVDRCRQSKALYAGLQYSKECWCGTNYNKYGRSYACALKCRSGEICGGHWANSVFKVGSPDCSCSVSGDPHYKTFDGQMIHFMGTCKYTLAISTKDAPEYFNVEVKNEHRGNKRVSYTRMVDIKFELLTIRLLPGNVLLVDGHKRTAPYTGPLGITVTYSGGWMTVSTTWGLRVQFDGKHRANVKVPGTFANKLTGICGDCNGKKDDLRTKDGVDVSKDHDKFSKVGKSHQVKDDSDKPKSSCDVTDVSTVCTPDQTQRCDMITNSIFAKCRKELGDEQVKEYLDSCRIDACIYHNDSTVVNKVVCEAIEGFARECEQTGFPTDWRAKSKCGFPCGTNQEYHYNALVCQPSCTDPKPKCTEREEACICKKGYILSGDDCVPQSQCGCVHLGKYMKVNEEILQSNCQTKIICQAGGKVITKESPSCPRDGKCQFKNGEYACGCKEGFEIRDGNCVQECEITMADVMFLLDDSQHMLESSSNKVKQFMKQIVSSFHIGDDRVRVGSVSFSNWLENNFHLNHHSNMPDLLSAIDGIKRRKRTSFMDLALDYLQTQSFTAANGDRADAPNIAIIITDGKPETESKTLTAAKSIKSSGVIMFVISVGNGTQMSDLAAFGSEPSSEFVYTMDTFEGLDRLKTKITKRLCSVNVCDTNPCKNGGKCVPMGKQYKCECTDPFKGKDCSQMKPDCSCSVSGDPHYRTFDGQMIHFMGICKYTLASSAKGAPHYFAVEVKNEHRGNTRVSYTRMVDVKLDQVTIRLLPGNIMLVNGEKRSLPINNIMGFSAKYAGGWITVTTEWGLRVQFDGKHRANVKVPATFINQMSGICGDCNGKKDDIRTKNGTDVSKDKDRFSKVGDSHKVKDDSDKPEAKCTTTEHVKTECKSSETKVCDLIQHPIFKECRIELGEERVKEYLESCKIDACIYHDDKALSTVVCQAIEGFARECEDIGFPLDWRGVAKCKKECPANQEYKFNALKCQPSCTDPQPKCDEQEEACVCKEGFILSGENCVKKSQCGCMNNGNYMKVNEEIADSKCYTKTICKNGGKLAQEKLKPCHANSECSVANGQRSCVCKQGFELRGGKCLAKPCYKNPCKNGGACIEKGGSFTCQCQEPFYGDKCSKKKPDCSCSVSGDPHYKTFDGQMIHFMGICKYTLATSTKQAPHYFAVEVKNEHRGNNRVSYTRMVDVKLTNNVTIRLLPGHKMLVNGEARSLPINNIMGFSAKYAGGWITVTTEWGLKVQFDGRHRANVKVPATFANQLSGICGDCNGKKDDIRTKDGTDVSKDKNRFSKVGDSHKVKDDSDKPEAKCTTTEPVKTECKSSETKVCDLIQHPIFKECRIELGEERVKEYLESCKIDACIYHDDKALSTVVCQAIEGFARECEDIGFPLDWRGVAKCKKECPVNQEYKFNALKCQPSCTDPQPKCDEQEEACVCKEGFILSGENCVKKSQCGCMNNGNYMKVNEEIADSTCYTKTICKNGGKLAQEKLKPCHANSECSVANGQRSCVCKQGFELRGGKCLAKPCYKNPCKNGGACIEKGSSFTCQCQEPFYGDKCSKKKPDCSCSVSGDPHYKTFDGQMIHFMGICKYTLATSTKQAPHYFAVEVKNEHRGNNRVSYTRLVDVKLTNNVTIRLLPGHKMLVNGEARSLPINNIMGFSAKYAGGWITVTTEWGLKVQFDGRHRANVKVPATFANQLSGICGDCNGKKDDIRTKNGTDVSKDKNRFSKVGDSHKVKDDSDKPEAKCTTTEHVKTECKSSETKVCDLIQHPIFKECRIELGEERVKEYLESCKIDACIYHDDKALSTVVCQAIEGFARECEDIGFPLDWRGVAKCKKECPVNQEYKFNALKCQPSCTDPQPKCDEQEEACVCKEGFILSGENCVKKSQCGCMNNGNYMKVNEEIADSTCYTKTICKNGGKLAQEKLKPCHANSECSVANGQRSCVCKQGFELRGGKCLAKPCYKNPCKNGGACIEKGSSFTCQCQEPFYGDKCSKKKPDCSCSVSGDPHYKTFDGQMIHFMGICKYTLATSTKQAPHYFAVEVKNEHRGNNRVSYTRMVDVKLTNNVTIRLLPGHKMLVNGEARSLPINNIMGFSAKYAGGWITVTTEWGLKVQFDGRHRANVKVPATFANQLSGICGDCNGKKDDIRTKNGTDVSKDKNRFSKVGDSHKVKDDSDKPEAKCTTTEHVKTECKSSETKVCDLIQHPIFKECRIELGEERVKEYLESCKIDACIYHDDKALSTVVCQAIEGFARECEDIGFPLDWRGVAKCKKECPVNQEYKFNALKCQPSCTDPQPKCDEQEEACVCKEGFILSGENCVKKSQCGCMNNGNYMKVNEEIADSTCYTKTICKNGGKLAQEKLKPCHANSECSVANGQRSCVCKQGFELRGGKCLAKPCYKNPCKNGGACIEKGSSFTCQCQEPFYGDKCSKKKPDCSCSVSGDPHYKTFDGQMIHFMGICKYTLATSTKQAPHYFAVEVKNEHRGNNRVSYTRMVDVKLTNNVTIRLLPGHKMLVNGEARSLPINNIMGFSAKYAGGWITVTTEWGLKVQFDGRHRANVKVPATFANQLSGICGDCNGKKDDIRTKNGTDVSKDKNRFSKVGDSHKVKDDSDKPEAKCTTTEHVKTECKSSETKVCDLIQHPIFKECRIELGEERVKEYLESCKIDACIYHDDKALSTVVCQAIEGFARECEDIGFPLDWRGVAKCKKECPVNQEYKFNALKCQPSCTDPQPKCDEQEEACVCKEGFILSGENCVKKSQCGCMNNGNYMKVNEEIADSKCYTKTICKNGGKLAQEKLKPCHANSECSVANGQRSCVCKQGFELRGGKCLAKPCYKNPCKNGGACIEKGSSFTCQCQEPFYGDKCSKKKPDCSCSVSGDPHYKTFDGQMIHFMGICKYTLATSTKQAPHYFAVEVKNEHRGNNRVSYTRMVDVKLTNNVTIRLLPGHKMLVNGEARSLPINNIMGFSAKYAGGWITVTTEWGLKVQFDGRHRANVKVPATFANQLSGICGDCNGKKDDIRTKNGTDVSKDKNRFSKVGDSHKVKDDSDKPEAKCTTTEHVKTECKSSETKVCDLIQHPIFKECRIELGEERVKEYLESCKIDACIYHDDKALSTVVCQAIEGFARECEDIGFPLDWRGVAKCSIKCPANQVYKFNALKCQPSCTDPQPKCDEQEEACVCKPGFILSGETCVRKSQCGCMNNGNYMKVNEEIPDSKCQTKTVCKAGGKLVTVNLKPCHANSECSVANGQRTCVCKKGFELQRGKCIEKPACSCSVSGDPHYKTFDGQMIHFMGICKYTLATSTKQAPHYFAVEVKNEHRGNNRVSYTRMVDVKLANNVTIRLLPGHKMLVDGEKRSLPINNFLGFSAKYAGGWITVTTEWGLKVQFDGRHRANVKVPATFANQLSGICGDCNGKKDDIRTKDGTDVSKDKDRFSKVGDSHKVKDDSDKPESKCRETPTVVSQCTPAQTQKCDLIQNRIFSNCGRKLGVERVKEYLDSCKIDACIYQNDSTVLTTVVCEAIEGFARECEEAGYPLNWRRVSNCAMTCPPNQVYQYNAFACQASCSEPNPKCKERGEACVCKRGYILSGEDCVPKDQCGCIYQSSYMQINEEILDADCQQKSICKAGGKLVTEKMPPCQPYSTCRIESGKRSCICEEGFMLRDGKCTPKVDPCKANPCLNGGKCIAKGLTRTCECTVPFDGDNCSEIASDCVCTGSGDPHYKTFDGQWIHFMGTCKYTLAAPKNTSGLSYFAVEVKNEHRGNTRVAYTRLVDLKLYGVTIRMLQGNKLMVNGELVTLPLKEYMGVSAHFSAGWITVTTDYGIKVQFDGKHRVTVTVPNTYRNQLTGICGDCNGKKDDFKTKDGVDVSRKDGKFSVIGKSFRVPDDSDKPEKRYLGQRSNKIEFSCTLSGYKCWDPNEYGACCSGTGLQIKIFNHYTKLGNSCMCNHACGAVDVVETCGPTETKACNILSHPKGPFADCLAKLGSDATGYHDACVIDSCAYKNNTKLRQIVLCQAFETLARKCEEVGVFASWRDAAKCPMVCPSGMEFKRQTSACQPSCTTPYHVCDGGYTEGCVCKRGTILSGTECVPTYSCGCDYRGMYMKIGSSILNNDCSKKITCGPKRKIEIEDGCGENTMCAIEGTKRRCVCSNGYQIINGICRKVDVPQPPIIDPDFLAPVLRRFIRVSVAHLRGQNSSAGVVTADAESCAKKCLESKTCKSFNYNHLEKTCVLLSINAMNKTLVSSDCPYQDYYHLIDFRVITIRGATMLSCNHLESIENVNSWEECQKLFDVKKFKAMEYSSFKKICSLTSATRKSYGLTGDELWDYHSSPETEAIGCFQDKPGSRALPMWLGDISSVAECIEMCSIANQPYAGLQNGTGCRCGKDFDKYGKATNCNRKCVSGEICGGFSANTVYKVPSPRRRR